MTPLTILAVDDDLGDIELLRRYLDRLNDWLIDFKHTATLDGARACLTEHKIDVVVLDFMLGANTGLELLAELREGKHGLAVIMVTGQGDEETAATLLRAGADDYLVKNALSPDSLRRSIHHALNCRARRAVEEELRQANDKLQVLLEQAEAATRAKGEFLANISHEIRTPLAAMLGFAELLNDTLIDSDQIELAATIRRNGDHLLTLINDILDLSKIEAGKLQVERLSFPLHALVQEVATLMRPRAESKGITFEVHYANPAPETICSDPTRLRQVLLNLIGNAIKFTEIGGVQLQVTFHAAAESDSSGTEPLIHFAVVDTGIGISEAQLANLFRPFNQADTSTTRRFGGTGLGLTICKRLATLLGDDISVRSTVGEGSTFEFSIPTGDLTGVRLIEAEEQLQANAEPDPTAATPAPNALPYRILIVDDGPDLRRLATRFLNKAGAEVVCAENGLIGVETALAAEAEGKPFDVVLLDMQMPVMDGYEAARQLRANAFKGPIIALTASAMLSERDECIKAGCDKFMSKPINRASLITGIHELLIGYRDTCTLPAWSKA